MKISMSAYFAKLVLFVFVIEATGTDGFDLSKVGSRSTDVYIGWPHNIKCRQPRDSLCTIVEKATETISKTNNTMSFLIGNILYDQSTDGKPRLFDLGDVTEDTPTEYVITYQDKDSGNVQRVEVYTINIVNFPQQTLLQAMEDESPNFKLESYVGDEVTLDCESHNYGPRVYVPTANRICIWYYNGTAIQTWDGRKTHWDAPGRCNKKFPSLQKEQYGVYSCSIKYNSQTRFMTNYRLHYKPSISYNTDSTIVCPTEPYKVKLGESITIAVKIILGNGTHHSLDMAVYWRRPNHVVANVWRCDNYGTSEAIRSAHGGEYWSDVQCKSFNLTPPKPQSTMDIASIHLDENFQTVVEAHLILNKVMEWDFGVYELKHSPSWTVTTPYCYVTLLES